MIRLVLLIVCRLIECKPISFWACPKTLIRYSPVICGVFGVNAGGHKKSSALNLIFTVPTLVL